MRVAKIAKAMSNIKESSDVQWIVLRIIALAEKLEARQLWAASCVAATTSFRELGYLDFYEGKRFVEAMKLNALKDPSDLDDFETLAKVVDVLPQRTFLQSELNEIRETYSCFVEQYAADCGLSDPEDIRNEASRIESVGDLLGVDTDGAQVTLNEAADEIETERQRDPADWDLDHESVGRSSSANECSDSELDSMFRTL